MEDLRENNPDSSSNRTSPSIPQSETVQKLDPGILELAEMFKEYLIKDKEKEISALEIELHDRRRITYVIVIAVCVIVTLTVYLTAVGKFEGSTFAFFLGTSVGSLLTILGKMFTTKE